MILAMDAGNTNIEIGVFSQEKDNFHLYGNARYFTKLNITSDEIAFFIIDFLKLNNIKREDIKKLLLSSVVPPLDAKIKKMFSDYFHGRFIPVDHTSRLNVRNCYQNPREVGSDRLVNACYVYHSYKKDAVIIDMGTATTLCALNRNGDYLGGVIVPGISISLNALVEKAAKLPAVRVCKKDKILADNTSEALEAGIYYSQVYSLSGMIKKLAEEVKFRDYLTIATGGNAGIFEDKKLFDIIDPGLALKGLKVIADLNN